MPCVFYRNNDELTRLRQSVQRGLTDGVSITIFSTSIKMTGILQVLHLLYQKVLCIVLQRYDLEHSHDKTSQYGIRLSTQPCSVQPHAAP